MSEPAPKTTPTSAPAPSAPVPDYNVPAKTKFVLAELLAESDGTYSAFWPLLVVFIALIILFLYDVSYLRYRKLVLTEQMSQLVSQEKGEKTQRVFIDSLHDDLDKLTDKHADVAAIVNQYFPSNTAPVPAPSATK